MGKKLFDPRPSCGCKHHNRAVSTFIISVGLKVRGGFLAYPGQIPHQVSLQIPAGGHGHFCGASIIRPLILLTAAHCFAKIHSPETIKAVTGEHQLSVHEGTEQIRRVSRLILHEHYDSETSDNDIALLVLDEPLEFNNRTQPIRIPYANVCHKCKSYLNVPYSSKPLTHGLKITIIV